MTLFASLACNSPTRAIDNKKSWSGRMSVLQTHNAGLGRFPPKHYRYSCSVGHFFSYRGDVSVNLYGLDDASITSCGATSEWRPKLWQASVPERPFGLEGSLRRQITLALRDALQSGALAGFPKLLHLLQHGQKGGGINGGDNACLWSRTVRGQLAAVKNRPSFSTT